MVRLLLLIVLIALSGLMTQPALAEQGVKNLGEKEFLALATELSHKVNLFRDVWSKDPAAEFYGGTSRDFLYWIKRQFISAHSPEEAEATRQKLLKLQTIDLRDFIIGESDVDMMSRQTTEVSASQYGVKNIDHHGPEIFDPTTELGKSELEQGFIPAEKIRLNSHGIVKGSFGDGAGEIYRGHLTLHAPDPALFAQTKYAREKINHPVLLALRFLRLQAMNYFNATGEGYPEQKLLFNIDPATETFVRSTIKSVTDKPELLPYLEKPRFGHLLNGVIQKMFRSYTNPTAAMMLAREFGVDKIPLMYQGVEPINQYLFVEVRDPVAIKANMKTFSVNEEYFFDPPQKHFPNNSFYHGTKTELAFSSILRQGVLPSEKGSFGPGLYGVNEAHREFSEKWAGEKNRLIRFQVEPSAKVVNISEGEGKRVIEAFGGNYQEFTRAFGVDIIRYAHGDHEEFAAGNSAVLRRPEGVYRSVFTLSQAMEAVEKALVAPGESLEKLKALSESLQISGFSDQEMRQVADIWVKSKKMKEFYKTSLPEFLSQLGAMKLPGRLSENITQQALLNYAEQNLLQAPKKTDVENFLRAALTNPSESPPTKFYESLIPLIDRWRSAGLLPASTHPLRRTDVVMTDIALPLLFDVDLPTPERLAAMDKIAGSGLNDFQNHTVIATWVRNTVHAKDADFILDLLRHCDLTNHICSNLIWSKETWDLLLGDSRTATEAWHLLFKKFWPSAHDAIDFSRHPLPPEKVAMLIAEGQNYWKNLKPKSQNYDFGRAVDSFTNHIITAENFLSSPGAPEFLKAMPHFPYSYEILFNYAPKILAQDPKIASQLIEQVIMEIPGPQIIQLLEQEPWRSHPLRTIWLKMANIPLLETANLGRRGSNRAKAFDSFKKRHPNIAQDTDAWAQGVKNPNLRVAPSSSCGKFFRALFGS